jgi:hypothetical protein
VHVKVPRVPVSCLSPAYFDKRYPTFQLHIAWIVAHVLPVNACRRFPVAYPAEVAHFSLKDPVGLSVADVRSLSKLLHNQAEHHALAEEVQAGRRVNRAYSLWVVRQNGDNSKREGLYRKWSTFSSQNRTERATHAPLRWLVDL